MWSTEPQWSVSANNLMSNSLFLKKLWLSSPIFKWCALKTQWISHCLNTLPLNLMNLDGPINFNCCVKIWLWSHIWWAHRYLTTCGENGLFFFQKKKSEKRGRESTFITGIDSSIHVSSLRLENKSMKTNYTFAHNTVCGKCGGGLNKSQSK